MQSPNDVTTGTVMREPGSLADRWITRVAGTAVAWAALTAPCAADTSSVRGVLEDTGLYFTAPLRWDAQNWLQFGASVAAVAIAHESDDEVRAHFEPSRSAGLTRDDPHGKRDFVPAAAMVFGTWALATALDDPGGYEEGRVMLEAGALTGVTTVLIKRAAGRLRPNEAGSVDEWRQGSDSFPSFHASAAFAVGTVLAESGGEDYRWLRRALGYGLATATAYSRVHDNVHWFSDTVAGAALGIATAQFAMGRRGANVRRSSVAVTPMPGGAMLTYSYRFE